MSYGTTMLPNLLKFIIAAFVVIEVCVGSGVLLKLRTGVFLERWTVAFMNCCLIASVMGVFVPFDSFLPLRKVATFAILVLVVVALAWHEFDWRGISILVSALSIILILCLNCAILVGYVFSYLSGANRVSPSHCKPLFIIAESVVILSFAGLGGYLIRRFDDEKIHD